MGVKINFADALEIMSTSAEVANNPRVRKSFDDAANNAMSIFHRSAPHRTGQFRASLMRTDVGNRDYEIRVRVGFVGYIYGGAPHRMQPNNSKGEKPAPFIGSIQNRRGPNVGWHDAALKTAMDTAEQIINDAISKEI